MTDYLRDVDDLARLAAGAEVSAGGGESLATAACERLLDHVAVAIAGAATATGKLARAVAANDMGQHVLIGSAESASPGAAAAANAVQGHATLQEDWGPGGHPGTVVIPAVISAGQCQPGVEGSDILAGIVAGYGVANVLGSALQRVVPSRGQWRNLLTIGPAASAAASARVLGLQPSATAAALSLAMHQAGGLYQSFADGGQEGIHAAGWVSRAGLDAALAARAGVAYSRGVLHGPHGFLASFGGAALPHDSAELHAGDFWNGVSSARSKRFPACALNQRTMEVLRDMFPSGTPLDEVRAVRLRRPAGGRNGLLSVPGVALSTPQRTVVAAQMSAAFCAAAALVGPACEDYGWLVRSSHDDRLWQLSRSVELDVSEGTCEVEVTTRAGGPMRRSFPEASLWTAPDVRARFERLVAPVLGAEVAKTLLELCASTASWPDASRAARSIGHLAAPAGR